MTNRNNHRFRLGILTTGGTIDKTYDETDGSLRNTRSVLGEILSQLRLPELDTQHIPVMSKDSLDMTAEDRNQILEAAREASRSHDALLVVHGTDTLEQTGELLVRELQSDRVIVLTGAFRPYEFRDSDALQNVTEAIFCARHLKPGVYVAIHGRALRFPGVRKDRELRTFVAGKAQVTSS